MKDSVLNKFEQIKKEGLQIKQSNAHNPSIDLIIAQKDLRQHKITLIAIDLTVGVQTVDKKLKQFVKKYTSIIEIGQNKYKLNNQQYEIELRYYVIGPKVTSIYWS